MKLVLVDRWKGSFEATCMARRSEGRMLAEVSVESKDPEVRTSPSSACLNNNRRTA